MAGIGEGAQKRKKHATKNHDRSHKDNKSSQAKPQQQNQQVEKAAVPPPQTAVTQSTKVNDQKSQNNKNDGNDSNKNKRKRQQEVFPFGNYRSYYGYRIGSDTEEDPRIKVLKKEWFQDKDCLDIGCNAGIITIQIAKKFQCRSILGVDIDHSRIKDADWHLRKFDRLDNDKRAKTTESEVSINGSESGALSVEDTKENPQNNFTSKTRSLFDVVSFRQENFIHSRHPPEKHYDAILCLSVSKWIHLNWGDDGLITLFSKIWRLLRPGGIFILEPQPWKSYESNRSVSETTQKNYQNIMLGPDRFQEILLDKIGFRMVEDLSSSLSGSKTGFNRPIFAFHK